MEPALRFTAVKLIETPELLPRVPVVKMSLPGFKVKVGKVCVWLPVVDGAVMVIVSLPLNVSAQLAPK
jgi:hypothetical protein